MISRENGGRNFIFSIALFFSAAALLLLLSAGCKGVHVYHPNKSVIYDPQAKVHTAFIEFDDQGELLRPAQITNATAMIKASDPVFLVTFVHGWKNNADFQNQNFIHFTNMLAGFAENLPDKKLKVFGVYLGWRGDPVAWHDPVSWVARNLSFWSRHAAAERVAGTSATEAIYSILQVANANTNSRVVLIGHSFGGLILEKALGQAMVSSIFSETNSANVKSPADLVLLINPAASSIHAREFISMLSRMPVASDTNDSSNATGGVFNHKHPLIISATSKGDWATGDLFPFGMWFAGLPKAFRAYDTNDIFNGKQFYFYRTTPGHNQLLLSHEIEVSGRPKRKRHPTLADEQATIQQNLAPRDGTNRFAFQINQYSYRIKPITNALNQTPYWVMQVPRSIIRSHDDILNERFTGFVSALLSLSQVTDTNVPIRELNTKQFQMAK